MPSIPGKSVHIVVARYSSVLESRQEALHQSVDSQPGRQLRTWRKVHSGIEYRRRVQEVQYHLSFDDPALTYLVNDIIVLRLLST
jgi:regulator of PEP synthase PpsR (kinase-PPPase family)